MLHCSRVGLPFNGCPVEHGWVLNDARRDDQSGRVYPWKDGGGVQGWWRGILECYNVDLHESANAFFFKNTH